MDYTDLRDIGNLILSVDLETAYRNTILDISDYFDIDTIREFVEERELTETYYMRDLDMLSEHFGAVKLTEMIQLSPHFCTTDDYIVLDERGGIRTMSTRQYRTTVYEDLDRELTMGLDFLGWAHDNNKRAEFLGFIQAVEKDLLQLWDVDKVVVKL